MTKIISSCYKCLLCGQNYFLVFQNTITDHVNLSYFVLVKLGNLLNNTLEHFLCLLNPVLETDCQCILTWTRMVICKNTFMIWVKTGIFILSWIWKLKSSYRYFIWLFLFFDIICFDFFTCLINIVIGGFCIEMIKACYFLMIAIL